MALDRVFVPIKIGDNGQYLDSMILGNIDERDWGLPFEKIVVPGSLGSKVYRYAQVDRALIPKLQQLQSPVGFLKTLGPMGEQLPDPETHKIIGGVLPLVDVAAYAKVDVADLRNQSEGKEPINLVGVDLLKDIRVYTPEGKIVDLRTINGGSYTVGAAGSYATWALFGADLTTLIAALTGTQISNTAETAQALLYVNLGGHTLLLTSNANHLGNFGSGWQSTYNVTTDGVFMFYFLCSSSVPGAIQAMSKINIKYIGAGASLYNSLVASLSNSANVTTNITDTLVNCGGVIMGGVRSVGANNILNMFNCVIVNGVSPGAKYANGIYFNNIAAASILENITIYGFSGGNNGTYSSALWNATNAAFNFRNIAGFTCTPSVYHYGGGAGSAGLGNAVAAKCASSDTTGSEAGLRSLVAANQFQSLTLADGDPFLKLKAGSALLGAGVAPSIAANTYGIRGNARPHGGLYSIGADEWKVTGGNRILRGVGRGTSRGMR